MPQEGAMATGGGRQVGALARVVLIAAVAAGCQAGAPSATDHGTVAPSGPPTTASPGTSPSAAPSPVVRFAVSALVTQDNTNRIFVVASDGSGGRQLTAGPYDLDPDWSPDGTLIAFASRSSISPPTPSHIVVIAADGSGRTELTHERGSDYAPAWSPDGSRIAFLRSTYGMPGGDGSVHVVVMDADGTNVKDLGSAVQPPGLRLSWAPDGRRIVVAAWIPEPGGPEDSAVGRLVIVSADGSGRTTLATDSCLPDGASDPDWSPDGTRILFRCGRNGTPALIAPDGSGFVALPGVPTTAAVFRWSPDGARIAGCSGGGIVVLGLDGLPSSDPIDVGVGICGELSWAR